MAKSADSRLLDPNCKQDTQISAFFPQKFAQIAQSKTFYVLFVAFWYPFGVLTGATTTQKLIVACACQGGMAGSLGGVTTGVAS